MIVLPLADAQVRLIRQQDHARMCGQLGAAWRRPRQINEHNWQRLLQAARHHDDGWACCDAQVMLDEQGRPYDFLSLPSAMHMRIWREGVRQCRRRDRWVGLLVELLIRGLYRRYGKVDALHQAFVQAQDLRIDRLIEQLRRGDSDDRQAVEPRVLEMAWQLLAGWDQLSLRMLGALPGDATFDSLCFGVERQVIECIQNGDTFSLAPWPLAKDLSLEIPSWIWPFKVSDIRGQPPGFSVSRVDPVHVAVQRGV